MVGGRRRRAALRSALVRALLVALAAPLLDLGDRRLLFLEHAVEEVDHPLRVQQRVEPVVGPQLQQLAELAPGFVGFVLEQVGDAQHAVRLDDLALAVEQHVRVEQRVQDLDRALVLGASERGAPAIEGVARRAGVAGAGPVGPTAMSAPASAAATMPRAI